MSDQSEKVWKNILNYQEKCPGASMPRDIFESFADDLEDRIKELEAELKRTVNESIEVIHDQGAKIIVLESAMQEFVDRKVKGEPREWSDWSEFFTDTCKYFQQLLKPEPVKNPCGRCGKEWDSVKTDECPHCGNEIPF